MIQGLDPRLSYVSKREGCWGGQISLSLPKTLQAMVFGCPATKKIEICTLNFAWCADNFFCVIIQGFPCSAAHSLRPKWSFIYRNICRGMFSARPRPKSWTDVLRIFTNLLITFFADNSTFCSSAAHFLRLSAQKSCLSRGWWETICNTVRVICTFLVDTITCQVFKRSLVFKNRHILLHNSTTTQSLDVIFCRLPEVS